MAMSGFICHDDYYDRLKRLSNEELGNLFRQLMLYHAGRNDEMGDFIGVEGIAFDFIASDIDRMEEKHDAISETNRINGLKGGRPKKQPEPEETDENRQKPTETDENRTKPYKDKDKEKDKDIKEILFDRFWAAYPRHEGKQNARKAFDKLKPDEDLLKTMLDALEKQKKSAQWTEDGGQYIPHPATWLNGKRWEDETKPVIRPVSGYHQRDYSGETEEAFRRMMEG